MNKKTSIIARIRELFQTEEFAADYVAVTNEIIRCLGDSLRVGEKVVQILQGEEANLPDGSYLLDNGKSIIVAAGEIKEINEYKADEKMSEENFKEDKDTGAIIEKKGGEEEKDKMGQDMKDKMADYNNEILAKLKDGTEVKVMSKGEVLMIGDLVMVKDKEGKFVPAPEGQHELMGGLVINLDKDSLINQIETKETEDMGQTEDMKSMFESVSELTNLVKELKKSLNSVVTENKELVEKFNKFSAEPSVETITKKHETLSKTSNKVDKAKFFGGK